MPPIPLGLFFAFLRLALVLPLRGSEPPEIVQVVQELVTKHRVVLLPSVPSNVPTVYRCTNTLRKIIIMRPQYRAGDPFFLPVALARELFDLPCESRMSREPRIEKNRDDWTKVPHKALRLCG
jgi:hypothetical protein